MTSRYFSVIIPPEITEFTGMDDGYFFYKSGEDVNVICNSVGFPKMWYVTFPGALHRESIKMSKISHSPRTLTGISHQFLPLWLDVKAVILEFCHLYCSSILVCYLCSSFNPSIPIKRRRRHRVIEKMARAENRDVKDMRSPVSIFPNIMSTKIVLHRNNALTCHIIINSDSESLFGCSIFMLLAYPYDIS